MKLKMLTMCLLVLMTTSSEMFARQFFNKSKDLLLANFDLRPDEDDIMAAAALASMLKHSDLAGVDYYVVAGAYGIQGGSYITSAVPGFYNSLFGAENQKWTHAHSNWTASVNRVRDKVKAVINAGGKVFVQEAGQSDFTHDMLKALINSGVAASTVKSKVIVVQHSQWNEDKSTQWKLNWVKNNTDYNKIADGNSSNNSTPGFNTGNNTWLNQAKSSNNPNASSRTYWSLADNICDNWTASWENPTIAGGGVDFSDCVENWWIFNIGNSANTISKFWNRYVVNSGGGNNGGGNNGGGNGGGNNGGAETVNCSSLPSSVASGTSFSVSVPYSANQSRDVIVELWNSGWLGYGKTTVSAGTGTATVVVNVSNAPSAGSNYLFKTSIRPVGTNWQQNINGCTKTNVTVTSGNNGGGNNGGGNNGGGNNGGAETVSCSSLPTSVASGTSFNVSVAYSANQSRDVIVELWNSGWLGYGKTTVNSGTGTATITVNVSNAPSAGSNYLFKASIRPVGTNWQQNIDGCTKTNVTVSSGGGNNGGGNNGGNNGGSPVTTTLSPIQDAYIQGSNGYNNSMIRIESGSRTGYLMFDLSSINGTITDAKLKLTCNGDSGNGNMKVNKGTSNNWTENNLSNSNKPGLGALLGSLNGSYNIGNTYTWNLGAGSISGGGNLSLVVSQAGGNDAAFASKENSASSPQLVITYTPSARGIGINEPRAMIYPNPVVGSSDFKLDLSGYNGSKVNVIVFDAIGRSVYEFSPRERVVDLNSEIFDGNGMYFFNIRTENTSEVLKLFVK